MFTFKDKAAAIEEWGNVGVDIADAVVSNNLRRRAPSLEANPIYGAHPTLGLYLGILGTTGMFEAGLTQYAHERYDLAGRHPDWVTYFPLAINAGLHGASIAISEHEFHTACHTAGLTCS